MKNILRGITIAVILGSVSYADGLILDISVGAGSVSTNKPIVEIGDSNKQGIAAEFKFDKPKESYLWMEFEHLIPIIPNIRYEKFSSSYQGSALVSGKIGGYTFTKDTKSDLGIDNQDLIAFWEVPFADWLLAIDDVNFGLGVKTFDGKIDVNGAIKKEINPKVPYLYGRVHITPPFLFGIGFEAEVKYISYKKASFNENIIKVDWSTEIPIPVIDLLVGVEAGYRSMSMKYDANGDDLFLDLKFTAIFLGGFVKFGI